MTKLFLNAILILICGCAIAQKNYEKSESFQEFDGWTKLIQLRNNNTGLIEITKKEGINFTLFNPSHKKITSGKLPLSKIGDKLEGLQVDGVYDISGDFVIFIIYFDLISQKQNALFRIIIDGNTGKLKSEENICEIDNMTSGNAYGMVFSDTDTPTILVEKDPDSDYYAVIKCNYYAPETKDRIVIFHYGPDHKIINKANYNTPTDKYKYTNFLSAYIHGSDYVLISTFAYNTKKSGGEETRYYVAQLNNGKTTFIQKELKYTEFTKTVKSFFIYNKPKDNLNMILIIKNYQINQNINPTSMALSEPFQTDFKKINELYKSQTGSKKDFLGMIQGSFVDKNGNIVYLYQETIKNVVGGDFGMSPQVESTIFGNVALVTMSPEGKEISSAVFNCNIFRIADHDPLCYNSAKKGQKINLKFSGVADSDSYYGIDFISTENGSYLFFNNTIDNMEKPDTKPAGMIKAISGTNGVKYTYKAGKITKDYMFGKPENKKEAKFINPSSSDFNATTKTYATIVTDPKLKQSTVVWSKLD